MSEVYDLIIVGGGPCGLSAGVYAGRSGMKTLMLEEYACGGQILNTYEIKNYPGFENVSGPDLAQKMQAQAATLGVEIKFEQNGALTVDVYLNLYIGYNVPDVAYRVQENIRNSLATMVALKPLKINIHVNNVECDKEAEEHA